MGAGVDAGTTRAHRRLAALAGDLAASEERYRTLFETMPRGIVHYDADGSVIGANRAAGEILGIDLAAAKSWPVFPDGEAVREDGSPFPPGELPVPVALRTGEIVAGTVAGVRHGQTGELRWVRITAVPDARDEQGRPSRAYAIFADLIEQRRAQTALRESTALLGRLREANVLGVVVVDEHRRLLRPGARLLLYTDGLIEDRHRDICDGLEILAETLRRSGPSSAEQTCAAVHAALLGSARRDDDVCLLTARLTGSG